MRAVTTVAMTVLVLSGCASVGTMSADQMAKESIPQLCDRYASDPDERLWKEIEPRAGFSAEEVSAISEGRVFVGMSENAMICAWGIPSHHGGIHKRITTGGVVKIYYYRDVSWRNYQYTEPRQVMLRDGRVTDVYP